MQRSPGHRIHDGRIGLEELTVLRQIPRELTPNLGVIAHMFQHVARHRLEPFHGIAISFLPAVRVGEMVQGAHAEWLIGTESEPGLFEEDFC